MLIVQVVVDLSPLAAVALVEVDSGGSTGMLFYFDRVFLYLPDHSPVEEEEDNLNIAEAGDIVVSVVDILDWVVVAYKVEEDRLVGEDKRTFVVEVDRHTGVSEEDIQEPKQCLVVWLSKNTPVQAVVAYKSVGEEDNLNIVGAGDIQEPKQCLVVWLTKNRPVQAAVAYKSVEDEEEGNLDSAVGADMVVEVPEQHLHLEQRLEAWIEAEKKE